MNSLTKKAGTVLTALILALSILLGVFSAFPSFAFAENETDHAYKYYYAQVQNNELAKNFYDAFEKLVTSGAFKKGVIEYDLIANGVATEKQVEAYVNGTDSNRLAKAYGAGRDAFYMDHPDLFYADVFATSITAGQSNGKYVAYLDSSRSLTTYRGDINSEAAVNSAIQSYEAALKTIVDGAKKLNSVKEKVEYVNNYIAQNNNYGYGTKVEGDRNVDTPKAAYVHTSYGALVNKESVCEGYAKSFNAAMDRLGIPCVCIQGAADGSGKGNYQPHMWNAVQVDGMWYLVDVTFNATSGNLSKFLIAGGNAVSATHVEDGSVSTSGFELRYPALKPYEYGSNKDSNDMIVEGSYNDSEYGRLLRLSASYEGKGALKLQEEGKYLAYRYSMDSKDGIEWKPWMNICAVFEAVNGMFTITDTETIVDEMWPVIRSVQFALINRAPDAKGDYLTGDALVTYSELTDKDFVVKPTVPYLNDAYDLSQATEPGAAGVTPSNSAPWPVDQTYNIKVVYSEELALEDGKTESDIGMDFQCSVDNDNIKQYATVTNVKWDGEKTITFTFAPSKMYQHNTATYYFTPTALIGGVSQKTPIPVQYSFKGKSVVCSKVFNDGRLYMNVFGQPQMLDNSDLSVTDFKDENGKYYAASQRSQLLLVASKPNAADEQKMDEVLKKETGMKNEDVVSSSTYEIDLQVCGHIAQIPNGSYMQVAFGFPEGYSPDDAGTTFKIYHYKRDASGKIVGVEEIPVIVTEYGLIAKVSSFSPFTIVQLKNTSAAVGNSSKVNVYAYVNGSVGGTVQTNGSGGISEVTGDVISYNITAEEGYVIGFVRLNGELVKAESYKDGTLTLKKSDLKADNMLEVQFVTENSAKSYVDKGVTPSYGAVQLPDQKPDDKPVDKPDDKPTQPDKPIVDNPSQKPKDNAGVIIGIVVAVLVLAAGGFAAWWFLVKKKQPAKATASPKTKKTAATKAVTADSKSKAATKAASSTKTAQGKAKSATETKSKQKSGSETKSASKKK